MHNRLHRLQTRIDLFPLPVRWVFWGGLLIRLLFMPWIGHNDALFIPWLSFPITTGQFNIYEFWRPIFDAAPEIMRRVIWLSNPPLSYFTVAGWMSLLRAVGLLDPTGWTFAGAISIWDLQHIPRMMFLSKLLYLAFDMLCWLLIRQLAAYQTRTRFDALWFFSPILLVGLYMMGQTDIFAVFFISLSLYLIWRNRKLAQPGYRLNLLAALLLGVGGGYKMWPLLVLPFWAVMLERRLSRQLGLIAAGIAPVFVVFLAFLPSPTFRNWVLLNGFSTRFLDDSLGAGSWLNLSPYLVFYFACLVAVYYFHKFHAYTFRDVTVLSGAVLAGLFVLTRNWEFYWLVWLTPFLTLFLAELPHTLLAYYVISFYFLFFLFTGWNLGGELFIPLARIFLELYESPRLREVIFGQSDTLLRKMAVVAFSLFVVVLTGVILWNALRNRLPGEVHATDRHYWSYIVPAGGLFVYLAAIFANTLIQTGTSFDQIIASARTEMDPIFTGVYLLLVLASILTPVLTRRARA